jgi:undecaprenyl-diphosphatase
VDWEITHALNNALVGRDWLEDPIRLGSQAAVPIFAAATVGLWLRARPDGHPLWKRATVAALLSASVALAVDQLVANLIWARPRPFTDHPDQVHLFAGGSLDPSFPSDHAAAAFAIATAVFLYSSRTGFIFGGAAVLIAGSRIVEGLHYPTDVVAGTAIGALAGTAVALGAKPIVNKLTTVFAIVVDPLVASVLRAIPKAQRR